MVSIYFPVSRSDGTFEPDYMPFETEFSLFNTTQSNMQHNMAGTRGKHGFYLIKYSICSALFELNLGRKSFFFFLALKVA